MSHDTDVSEFVYQSSVQGPGGCYQFLVIMSQAAVSTLQGFCMKISLQFSGINAHESSSGLCLGGAKAASVAVGQVLRQKRGRSLWGGGTPRIPVPLSPEV